MRLSVLDQVPVTDHVPDRADAVAAGLRLAQDVEALGYHRIWFAEHHGSASFASPAPEMMAALALERTSTIRVGTGGILLPFYQAAKVIEVMTFLGHVHGDRVDTGVGRAAVDDPAYAEKIHVLVDALGTEHPAVPGEPDGRVWVLGVGGSAAPLAGGTGVGYAHGHFFVPRGGEEATAAYRRAATTAAHRPHTGLAVRAVTAGTPERAQDLADAMVLWRVSKDFGYDGPVPSVETTAAHRWTDVERTRATARAAAVIAGTPDVVAQRIRSLADDHGADEVMVNSLTSDREDRLTSYRLLAGQFAGA